MSRIARLMVMLSGVACMAVGQDVVFKHPWLYDSHGDAHTVQLVFRPVEHDIVVREKTSVLFQIPYDAVTEFSYDRSSKGLLTKRHWFTIHYKSPEGWSEEVVLEMFSGERDRIIEAANAQTGKGVKLPSRGK